VFAIFGLVHARHALYSVGWSEKFDQVDRKRAGLDRPRRCVASAIDIAHRLLAELDVGCDQSWL